MSTAWHTGVYAKLKLRDSVETTTYMKILQKHDMRRFLQSRCVPHPSLVHPRHNHLPGNKVANVGRFSWFVGVYIGYSQYLADVNWMALQMYLAGSDLSEG